MRLDWELCRAVMLAVEVADRGDDEDIHVNVDGRDDREVSYHARALCEAGYLRCSQLPDTEDSFTWYLPTAITYEGHRFLAATRDNQVWKRVLNKVGGKGASVTLDVVTALAVAEGKRLLGLTE